MSASNLEEFPGPPPSRVERVYRLVRDAIIEGEHLPGSPLRLQELADAHGVSLIPVREALRRLEAERLVQSEPNKGARVAEISPDDVRDVYQTRIVLEVPALRRAFPRLDHQTIEEIRDIKERMVGAFKRGDRTGNEFHRRIHFSLYERSESPWLLYMIEILWNHTERYRRMAMGLHPTFDHVGQAHAKILDALDAGDLDAASDALRLDLEHTAQLVIAAYEEQHARAV